MESEIGKVVLEQYRESALREIAHSAAWSAKFIRDNYPVAPFASDDARRFDELSRAINALWPRIVQEA